ncbi:MAG TPA: hypothetical protein ENG87_03425 [Candidatus Pacearchaeota archaeon]|nr:hypothetical protein BMS3Abin17_00525 [archaeon BMS3Abin17]HDK42404.1 hypothetical protein [Candidatus Pacearchaeota archaeon]HDZ60454.1 hypothetical protein [Candidatus Pacearchaeota archaeon]
MNKVYMSYGGLELRTNSIKKDNLNFIMDMGTNLRETRKLLRKKYGEKVSLDVSLFSLYHGFSVDLKGEDLENVLRDFMNLSGHPYFVSSCSDYNLVDKVHEHGKKLKRKGHGCVVGKWVVEDKPKQSGTWSNIWDVLRGDGGLGF